MLFPKPIFLSLLSSRSPRASVVIWSSLATYIAASLSVFSVVSFFSVPLGSDADLVAQSAGFLRDSDRVSLPQHGPYLTGEQEVFYKCFLVVCWEFEVVNMSWL